MTARFHRGRPPRGITIIETIVLMTGRGRNARVSVCSCFSLLMKLSVDSRARLDGATSLDRLARQFRRDVHEAGAARQLERPAAKLAGLRIEPGPRHAVEYQLMDNGKIARVETRDENLVAPGDRMTYPMPAAAGPAGARPNTTASGSRSCGSIGRSPKNRVRSPSAVRDPRAGGQEREPASAPVQPKGAKP